MGTQVDQVGDYVLYYRWSFMSILSILCTPTLAFSTQVVVLWIFSCCSMIWLSEVVCVTLCYVYQH